MCVWDKVLNVRGCVHVSVVGWCVFLALSRTLCVQEMAVTSSGINHSEVFFFLSAEDGERKCDYSTIR